MGAMLFLFTIGCKKNIHGELVLQQADPAKGFNFSYFLFIPEGMRKEESLAFIVEPNNTGYVSDDYDDHVEGARQSIENFGYLGKHLADSLKFPLLVPTFPRSETTWQEYTHALDRDAILSSDSATRRIDLQLIAMIDHARNVLAAKGYTVDEKAILTGFSASATFANRFVVIHPDKVKVCAAGGLNAMLMLPLNNIDSTALNYPLGIGDFQTIFGDTVNLAAIQGVPQMFFMGDQDDNDAVAYDDAYDSVERNIVYTHFGKAMQPDRWSFCGRVYKAKFPKVTIKTYKGTGHTITDEMRQDVLQFARNEVERK